MAESDKPKICVDVTLDQKAALEFIASQMDEAHRQKALNVGEELSLIHLHSLLWNIRRAMDE